MSTPSIDGHFSINETCQFKTIRRKIHTFHFYQFYVYFSFFYLNLLLFHFVVCITVSLFFLFNVYLCNVFLMSVEPIRNHNTSTKCISSRVIGFFSVRKGIYAFRWQINPTYHWYDKLFRKFVRMGRHFFDICIANGLNFVINGMLNGWNLDDSCKILLFTLLCAFVCCCWCAIVNDSFIG